MHDWTNRYASEGRYALLSALCSGLALLLIASCGGGGGGSDTPAPPPPATVGNAERAAAATATANANALCSSALLGSYYWEIGDVNGGLASGSIGSGVGAATPLNIASASKWLFAAYLVERDGDVPANVPYLNFTSGYSNFDNSRCTTQQTVAECNNGGINPAEVSPPTFHYQGGHMQQLAATSAGLGSLRVVALASEVSARLGSGLNLQYVEPLPPGGARTSASGYATFLRRLLRSSAQPLRLGALLGSHAVCTQPGNGCNAANETAARLPDNFHYSLGHWVEDDPVATPSSNFAYSSAGAFGFYPWVDADRLLYGVLARESGSGFTEGTGEGYSSVQCGRLIRLAWKTATVQ